VTLFTRYGRAEPGGGRIGGGRRVRDIRLYSLSSSADKSVFVEDKEEEEEVSKVLGSISLSGSGGDRTLLDPVILNNKSRQIAFKHSINVTTFHLVLSPFVLAVISHNNSVYCITRSVVAILWYRLDLLVQYCVYLLCKDNFGRWGFGNRSTALPNKES